MVPYFLASNLNRQNSKYAQFTLLDLAVELSASPRTQMRMKHAMVINISGRRGGGLFLALCLKVMFNKKRSALLRGDTLG